MSNAAGPDTALERDQRFEQLVERYQQPLLRMCCLYLCDKSLAEDAVQETFIKVYRSRERRARGLLFIQCRLCR